MTRHPNDDRPPVVSEGSLGTDLALDGPWKPFTPLDAAPKPSPFPVEALPDWLRAWAEAVGASVQVPVDVPATLGLGALSIAVAPAVDLKIQPGWTRPPTLALCAVMDSGAGKSPVFRHALAPIRQHGKTRSDELEPEIRDARDAVVDLEDQIREAKRRHAANPEDEDAATNVADLRDRLAHSEVPVSPVYVTGDATPEGLVRVLSEQGGGLGWASSEAEIWSQLTGRYGNGPNFDAIMNAIDGDAIRVDRKTKEPIYVDRPALSVVTTVQPVVVEGFAKLPGEVIRRGLVPRFVFIVPGSLVGRRRPGAPPVPAAVSARYAERLTTLLSLRDEAQREPEPLTLAPEALAVFEGWYFPEVEARLGPGGDLHHMQAFASKLRDAVPTVAALLHLADAHQLGGEVQPATMERAIAIGRYFLAHTRVAWEAMEVDEERRAARKLWAFAARWSEDDPEHGCRAITKRDLYQKAKGTFRRIADLDAVLPLLIAHGYVAEANPEREPGRAGRKPSPLLLVSPAALERDAPY
ncbi:MAG: YfjI family protein [Myxococcota bacterium]